MLTVLAAIALFASGILTGRVFTWVLLSAGLVMMVIGNPLWPDAVLRLLMSPVIYMMGFTIRNRRSVSTGSTAVDQITTQMTLRALGTLSVLLAIIVVLLVVCT